MLPPAALGRSRFGPEANQPVGHTLVSEPGGSLLLRSGQRSKLGSHQLLCICSSLVLQCLAQLAPQGSSQGGRDCIADLPVAVVDVAREAEVIREALWTGVTSAWALAKCASRHQPQHKGLLYMIRP